MNVLQGFWNYGVVSLLVLTVVVFIHEFGHFIVARWCGVKVETFSIGFGPELFGWTAKSGTRWRFSAIPIGGYVKMFGDLDPTSTPDMERGYTPEEQAVAFHYKSVAQRAAVVFAGPAANFISAVFAQALILMVVGAQWALPVVGEVEPGSAAAEAGLQPGDRIVQANGEAIERFNDLHRIILMSVGDPVTLGVERGDQRLQIVSHPRIKEVVDIFGNVEKVPRLGIGSSPDAVTNVTFGPIAALSESASEIREMVAMTFTGLGQMITGRRSADELGGPIRIAKGVGQAAELGIAIVIAFGILLSVNLGLVNLFPIPLLDGGRLLFYAIEAVMRRPVGPRVQEYGLRIGLFLVFALMLFVTRNDLADLRIWEHLKAVFS